MRIWKKYLFSGFLLLSTTILFYIHYDFGSSRHVTNRHGSTFHGNQHKEFIKTGEGNKNGLKLKYADKPNEIVQAAAKPDEMQASRNKGSVQTSTELNKESTGVSNNKVDLRGRKNKKLILIYTALFGEIPWNWIPNGYNFYDKDGTRCKVHHCEVTYDKSRLKESDLVIFHGQDFPPAATLKSLRPVNINQLWGFLSHESPPHTGLRDLPNYRYLFNWTITYRVDSNVFMPWFGHSKKKDESKLRIDYSKGKTRTILITVSHCFKERITFIKRLKEFIDVDVYGGCSKLFPNSLPECKRFTVECEKVRKQYKFYLAVENNICIDYVSEKYWENSLNSGLVPIVLSGANLSNPAVAIPGSYVNALDFSSFKELADYIHYLDKNNTAYNEYHHWRSKYETKDYNAMCPICENLHAHRGRSLVDLQKFWGIKETCHAFTPDVSPLFSGGSCTWAGGAWPSLIIAYIWLF